MSNDLTNDMLLSETVSGQLKDVLNDILYCPACGLKNYLEKNKVDAIYFRKCTGCGARINDCWDQYHREEIELINCISCLEPTFNTQYFCVSCGYKQKTVAQDKTKIGQYKSVQETSQGALARTFSILTANMRTRDKRATNTLLKKEFYGRRIAWRVLLFTVISSIIFLSVGTVLLFIAMFEVWDEYSTSADFYLFFGFILAFLGTTMLCCFLPLIVYLVARMNIKETEQDTGPKRKIGEIREID